MPQFGGKSAKKTKKTSSDSKRHFTVVMGNKEHGLYVSSTPSSAARKAVTKLCTANKSKKVEFYIREITQDSKKKTYGPYDGYIEKLKEPIELKGRIIWYKPVVKKRRMKGGGYNSSLSVNKFILDILRGKQFNNDKSVVFTVENIDTKERKEYVNVRFLGQGTYGKVFLVENNNKKYVIKISNDTWNENGTNFMREQLILNSFMNKIVNKRCQYKAITQGTTRIDGWNIAHIIFPFKGGSNLLEIIVNNNFTVIPKILQDILFCLININNFAFHGDLKLENIVYDEETNTGFIIDYGISFVFPLTIENLFELPIGSKQISVDIIIGYFLKFTKKLEIFIELYSKYLGIIQKTIDNFGLFWVIVESISDIGIMNKYISLKEELIKSRNRNLWNTYLNFYFNLDYKDTEKSTELVEELQKILEYTPDREFRVKFINDVRSHISSDKFRLYFSNEKYFIDFMEKVLALVRIDPTTRIPKEDLLQDPFFPKND